MSARPIKLLLIDDKPEDTNFIQGILSEIKSSSFDLEYTDRLSKGLERLGKGGIDLTLLDLSLPDSQGLDTLVKVKAQTPKTPIVVLTSFEDEVTAIEAVNGGAQDYLIKGQIDGNSLIHVIRCAIERKHTELTPKESKDLYQNLVENIDFGITLIDTDYNIVMTNSAQKRMLKKDASLLVGKKCYSEFEWCKAVCAHCPGTKAMAIRQPQAAEVEAVLVDGSSVTVRINTSPHFGPDGKVAGFIEVVEDITERKQVEETLYLSEKELKVRNHIAEIFLTIPDEEMFADVLDVVLEAMESELGIFSYIDENGTAIFPSMTRHVWDECQVPNKNIVFPPDKWAGIWGRCLREKKTLYSNESFKVPQGHVPIKRTLCVPIIHQEDIIGHFQVANKKTDYDEKDIRLLETIASHTAPVLHARLQRDKKEKERKHAEEELSKEKNYLERLHNSIGEAIFTLKMPERIIEYVNNSVDTIFGYKPEDCIGNQTEMFYPDEESYYEFGEKIKRALKKRVDTLHTEQLLKKKGGKLFLSEITTSFFRENGKVIRVINIVRDITERKRAEEELAKHREHLEELVEERTVELTQTNDQLKKEIAERKRAEEALFKSEKELKIRNMISEIFLTVPDEEVYKKVLGLVLKVMKSQFGTFGYFAENGSFVIPSMSRAIYWEKCNIPDKNIIFERGNFGGIWGRAVEEKKTIYSNTGPFSTPKGHVPIKNTIATPIVYGGKVISVFHFANKSGDYDDEDKALLETIAKHIAPVLFARLQRDNEEKERKQAEEEIKTRQKEIEEINTNLEKRVHEEVEKSRQKDLIMMHQSRLAAMGEMIGLIAHQWRQPLNALNILLYNIKDLYDHKQLSQQMLDDLTSTAVNLAMKMSSTIDDFRNFFRPYKAEEKFSINQIVRDSLSLVDASFKYHNISVTVNESQKLTVNGSPSEYSQVILNVLNNARDAIVANRADGEVAVNIFQHNGLAVVKIGDNGGGIPADVFERIFDPYFTVKESGEGTGLGLYLSKVIIEEHMDGCIEAHNIKDGTEFKITTPMIS